MDYKNTTTGEIIDMLCGLETRKANIATEINTAQAELQSRGLRILEDRNIKSTEFFGSEKNYALVSVAQKLEILNPGRLENLVGKDLFREQISKKEEVKHTPESAFKQALIALYMGDFEKDMTLEVMLGKEFPQLSGQQISLTCKKLKGDYKKDKATLLAVLGDTEADVDEELYFISRIKNFELIRAFFDENDLEHYRSEIKKCVMIDETPKITVKYEKD